MQRTLSLLLALLLVLSLCPLTALAVEDAPLLTIYHTNDMHGRIDSAFSAASETPIGLAQIAGAKAATPNSLLLDAGDALQGTPIAVLTQGETILDLMGEAGYDLMTVGNHDLDYGYDRLRELAGKAAFPIVCSNISRGGSADFDQTRIFELGGVKVGVFGLTNDSILSSIMPALIKDVVISSGVETAKKKVAELRAAGAQLVVAVCHIGALAEPGAVSSDQLAEAVPELDLIIDGHSHTEYPEGHRVGKTLIVSTGEHEHFLGRVELRRGADGAFALSAALLDAEQTAALCTAGAGGEKRAALQQKLSAAAAEYDELLDKKLGTSSVTLSGKRELVRTGQTPLGYLVAESYRSSMKANAAIANGGEIRADLVAGELTHRQLLTILPYLNVLQTKEITPAALWAALENGLSSLVLDEKGEIDPNSASGRYPQIAGASFRYDLRLPVGKRVLSVSLDDFGPVARDAAEPRFLLASSSFVLSGGDGYTMFGELPIAGEYGLTCDQALVQYLNGNAVTAEWIAAHNDGRVVRQRENYTVKPGDTLWGISTALYGNGYGWSRLYAANRAIIADPDLIYAGQVLTVAQ